MEQPDSRQLPAQTRVFGQYGLNKGELYTPGGHYPFFGVFNGYLKIMWNRHRTD
jgi:hypothetical protein